MSSTRVGGRPHVQVAELRSRVPAAHVLGRIAEHVVRVDQRDDQAEGLREVGALQPALGLLGVDLVPALAERPRVACRRSARPWRSRRRPAAPSRRIRTPVAGAPRPMEPSRRAASRRARRVGQVPLALVGDLVARPAEQLREIGRLGLELGLVSRLRPELEQAAPELAQRPPARGPGAAQDVRQGRRHGGQVARVGPQVGLRVRQRHAVLGGVPAGQQGRAARRAHRRVAEGIARRRGPCPPGGWSFGVSSRSQPGSSGQWQGWRCWSVISSRTLGARPEARSSGASLMSRPPSPPRPPLPDIRLRAPGAAEYRRPGTCSRRRGALGFPPAARARRGARRR